MGKIELTQEQAYEAYKERLEIVERLRYCAEGNMLFLI